jgi:hypothetical protein
MLGVCATPVLGADNDLTVLTFAEASDPMRQKTNTPRGARRLSELCGSGEYPKTFLIQGMKPYGKGIE